VVGVVYPKNFVLIAWQQLTEIVLVRVPGYAGGMKRTIRHRIAETLFSIRQLLGAAVTFFLMRIPAKLSGRSGRS
jgi:hypothetical protein